MDSDNDLGLSSGCLQALVDLDEQEEKELLEDILGAGWDLGALLTLSANREPPPVSPSTLRTLHDTLGSRRRLYRVHRTEPGLRRRDLDPYDLDESGEPTEVLACAPPATAARCCAAVRPPCRCRCSDL